MSLKLFSLPPKDELATKLINYPVLNSILCLLLYERLFRVALIVLFLLIPSIGLFVTKIWTASPDGFTPVIKLSGLDLAQAWSLKRTAVKQMAQGRFEDALYSWRIAAANNPVDPELLRGCLSHLLQGSDKRKYGPIVLGYSRWLLRLTQTNRADLELAAKLYDKYEMDDMVIYSLMPFEKQLSPPLESAYLKALFNRGRFSQFADRLEDVKLRGIKLADPNLYLYEAAYQAGWGPLDEASRAKKQLDDAKEDPARRVLAHRLQLKVSERLVQIEPYRKSLDFLQEWRQDRLIDHLGYWQLLASIGRKAEAVKLMQSHVIPPMSGEETVLLAKAYFDLGLSDGSREILKRYAPEFSDSESVWLTYANLLTEQKRWDDLIEVALQIRHENNPLRDALTGYSFYLEGMAELNRGRRPSAETAFRKIPETKIKNKMWELIVAEKLEGLQFPDIAKQILLEVQKEVPDDTKYWFLLAKTAFDLRDADLLVSALASAYKLRPDDWLIVNNYAAALLTTRQRPEEALALTTRVLQKQPSAIPTKINHGLALVRNGRISEAKALLDQIDVNRLAGADLSSYYYAYFEIYLSEKKYELAQQMSARIEPQYLFPTEKQWLEKARLQMQPQG